MREAIDQAPTSLEPPVQLLDDHHLVVLSEDAAARAVFAARLADQLDRVPESEVTVLPGGAIDLPGFCRAVQSAFRLKRVIRPDLGEIIQSLRRRPTRTKRAYLIWPDAEEMLEHDVDLFGRLVNALLAAAAEREYVSPDVLLLQRVIFLGGNKLGAYAECELGQFCTWRTDDEASTFWRVFACLDRPPVLTYRLDG